MPQLTHSRLKYRQIDFSGGQNSAADPVNVLDNQAEKLQNCIIRNPGECEQRNGYSRLGDNPDTLISHWTFDAQDSTDDKGSNDGTDTNISYVDGKFGKCASFNGTTSLITVGADSTIDVNSMGAFRISAWVYVDTDGEDDEGRIVDKMGDTGVGYKLYVFGESSSTVKVGFEVGDTGTNMLVTTTTTLSTEAWHKIDAIYNADRSGDIYIDGAIATYDDDDAGQTATADDSANNLIIGNSADASGSFDGKIDDLRIYDGAFAVDDVELDKIQGITRFTVGGTIDKVYRIKNTDLQSLDADFKGWTNVDAGFTADTQTNFVQANDILFILNGVDNVHTMDSAEAITDEGDTNTDPPITTFGEWATNNRLFLSGSLTDSERDYVWFSDALAPQTFVRDTNVFKVRSGAGGKITWLKMFKEYELIVYKNDSIFVLNIEGTTPLSDWDLKPLSVAIGCPAGRTVHDIGNDHIFLGNDGVRLLSRTSFDKLRVGIISEPIQDILDTINEDAIATSVAHFENGYYILGVPTGTATYPDRFFIWDSVAARRNGDPNSAWTVVPKGVWTFSCFTSFGFGDNSKTIVAGESQSFSLCYKVLNGNTDNGRIVEQEIITRQIDFGDPFIKKIFDPTQFVAETGSDGNYQYYIDLDRSGFTSIASSGTLSGGLTTPFTTPATTGGSSTSEDNERTKFVGRGNSARLKISNSIYNKLPNFLEYTIYAKPYGGRM